MKLGEIKIDVTKQEQGAWVDNVPEMDGVRFKVRGINNVAYRKLQNQLFQSLPRRKRVNGQIDVEDQDRITATCILNTVLDDWEGFLDEEGKSVPYSKERAREFLFDPQWRRIREAIIWAATVVGEQEAAENEEIAKN